VRTVAAFAVAVAGGILICIGVGLTCVGALFGVFALVGFTVMDAPRMLIYGFAATGLGILLVFGGPRIMGRHRT
jgi:hypothetical protein